MELSEEEMEIPPKEVVAVTVIGVDMDIVGLVVLGDGCGSGWWRKRWKR